MLLYGKNEAEERMKRETMEYNPYVSLSHDYYSEDPERGNRAAGRNKPQPDDKDIHPGECRARHAKGDHVKREQKAIGGAAKVRRKYPFT